ncbi:MAG: hypothetical protein HY553_12425 [Elusimicrobia bacterium]|nr:hypothetical protein [Elusimicrobiota bacterium]
MRIRFASLAAAALAAAAPVSASGVRFDTIEGRGGAASLLESVRRASPEALVPAIGAVKTERVFWGRDGRWCEDGRVYVGGPCDNAGGFPPPPPPPAPYPPPYPPSGDGRGFDAAMRVCRELFTDRDKLACLRVARAARWFDPAAVRVCRGMFSDSHKPACLEAVADADIGEEAARVCGGLFSDPEKLRCLREEAGGRAPYPPGPPPDGAGPAYDLCRELLTDRSKVDCLAAIRPARFFDPGALKVCRGMFTDPAKVSCLRTVADRSYGREIVRFCGGLFTDEDKLRCLRDN